MQFLLAYVVPRGLLFVSLPAKSSQSCEVCMSLQPLMVGSPGIGQRPQAYNSIRSSAGGAASLSSHSGMASQCMSRCRKTARQICMFPLEEIANQ